MARAVVQGSMLRHVAFVVALVALLAGCATDPAPRPAYTPPPSKLNTPVKPVDEVREERLGDVADTSSEAAAAGVRGLTFEEFRQCMLRKADIKSVQQRLGQASPVLDKRKKSIEQEDLALNQLRKTIDPSNGGAVDAYNARLHKQHELVRVFNAQIERYNGEVEQGRTLHRAYSLGCAERPFRSTDIDRLPPELQSVAREDLSDFDLPVYYTDDPPPAPKAGSADLDLSY